MIDKVLVKGHSFLFGTGIVFVVCFFILLVFASKFGFLTTEGILVCFIISLIIEYLILAKNYYRFYFFKDKIIKAFPLKIKNHKEIIRFSEVKEVIYIPRLSPHSPTVTLKIYTARKSYSSIKFTDVQKKKISGIIAILKENQIKMINKFNDKWLETQMV